MASIFGISCSIKGSLQGLSSYYYKTKSLNPQLLVNPDGSTPICEIKKSDTPKVYVINGINLKECIKTADRAIMYLWAPKCKGKFCYSLNSMQQKCSTKDISLFIVAEYYDSQLMQVNYKIDKPIFGIDVEYYQSNTTSKYLSKFVFDLTSRDEIIGRIIYFEDGKFVKSFESLEEI